MPNVKISALPTASSFDATDKVTGLDGAANSNFTGTLVEAFINRVSGTLYNSLALKAPLVSPAFTGTPTAPTATPGTNNTQIATTAYVDAAVVASTTGVSSFNTRTGAVTPATGDYTGAQITQDSTHRFTTDAEKTTWNAKAPLASPAFTGTPTAPTATAGTNTTQVATTAFVTTAVAAGGGGGTAGVSSFNGRTGAVVPASGDYSAAQLTTDSTHRVVTDAQIAAWNAGSTGVFSDPGARWFDVRDYGISPTNSLSTNNAGLATLWADFGNSQSGTVYFPEADSYDIELVVPTRATDPPGNWLPLSITIIGGVKPFSAIGTLAGGFTRTDNDWTILRSTGANATITGANGWIVFIQNMEVQQTGTAARCIDLESSAEAVLSNVLISNGTWPGAGVKSPGKGLVMPGVNNGGLNAIYDIAITSFDTGIDPGEHLTGTHLIVMGCTYGWYQGIIHHANVVQRYQTAHNIYDIYCPSGSDGLSFSWIQITQMDIEHNGACRSNIYDPFGGLRGSIQYCNILGGNGAFQQFVSSGHNPNYLRLGRTGDLFQDFTAPGEIIGSGNPLYPLSAAFDKWGQTLGRNVWYSYGYETEAGLDYTSAYTLAAGDDGWIAQKYVPSSKGGFVGLKTGGGAVIGFFFDDDGTLGVNPGNGTYPNTAIALVDNYWYKLNRTSGTYTVQKSPDGSSWTTVYTFSSPFSGTTPAGAYSAYMDTTILNLISPAAPRKAGPIYFPQASFGGLDLTPPTLSTATVENATPTHVDLVFNEPMDSTWSAASAFTVSGHTVSSITRTGSTTGYLTLTTAFVPGESRNLTYTQPGANNMKDLAGNLLANITTKAVVDNVLPTTLTTPSLTATVVGPTQIDLTWPDVANESSYKLERSLTGTGSWTQIGGTIAANSTSYSDTGLTASTHYYYRLSAIGDGVVYLTSGFGTDDDTTSAAGDTTPPTLGSGFAPDSNPDRLNLTFSEAMDPTWSASTAFTVSGHTVTGITRTGSATGYLTCTPNFIEGETQNLTYTQPGTNNMKDLAGNLLANIVFMTVVSGVTTPTLSTATVQDATPTHVDLVFSEPMNTAWSAPSAWGVTGSHTVTAVTQLTSTTGYLTLATPLASGEVVTLSYTQPGSNKMQDVGGTLLANITAATVNNNVGASIPSGFSEHWMADSGVSQSSGVVASWTGANSTVLASSSGTEPTYSATGSPITGGGGPYLSFNGSGVLDATSLAMTGVTDEITLFLVAKATNSSSFGGVAEYGASFHAAGGWTILQNTDSFVNVFEPNLAGDIGQSANKNAVTGSDWFHTRIEFLKSNSNGAHSTATDDPFEVSMYINGAVRRYMASGSSPETRDNTNNFSTSATFKLGGWHATSDKAHVDIAEVIIYPRKLTAAEVVLVEAYIAGKYTALVPAVHEDFESTSLSAIPSGWSSKSGNGVTNNGYFSSTLLGGTKEFSFTGHSGIDPIINAVAAPLECVVSADIVLTTSTGNLRGGVMQRSTTNSATATMNGYFAQININSATDDLIQLYKVVAGTPTLLASTSWGGGTAFVLQPGEVYTMEYRLDAAHEHRIRVMRNSDMNYVDLSGTWSAAPIADVLVFTETTPEFTSAGYAGAYAQYSGTGAVAVDNLCIRDN